MTGSIEESKSMTATTPGEVENEASGLLKEKRETK